MVGASLAVALGDTGLSVVVIEPFAPRHGHCATQLRRPHHRPRQRQPPHLRLLGVWDDDGPASCSHPHHSCLRCRPLRLRAPRGRRTGHRRLRLHRHQPHHRCGAVGEAQHCEGRHPSRPCAHGACRDPGRRCAHHGAQRSNRRDGNRSPRVSSSPRTVPTPAYVRPQASMRRSRTTIRSR